MRHVRHFVVTQLFFVMTQLFFVMTQLFFVMTINAWKLPHMPHKGKESGP
jgi:hypothetical protein